jgi:hypothetical protein
MQTIKKSHKDFNSNVFWRWCMTLGVTESAYRLVLWKNTTYRKMDMSILRWKFGFLPTRFGALERATLNNCIILTGRRKFWSNWLNSTYNIKVRMWIKLSKFQSLPKTCFLEICNNMSPYIYNKFIAIRSREWRYLVMLFVKYTFKIKNCFLCGGHIRLSVAEYQSSNCSTDFLKTRHRWRLPVKVVGQCLFSAILIHNKAGFAYGHKRTFPTLCKHFWKSY